MLAALDAFRLKHRRCVDDEGGVDWGRVWLTCSAGARFAHRLPVLRGPQAQ